LNRFRPSRQSRPSRRAARAARVAKPPEPPEPPEPPSRFAQSGLVFFSNKEYNRQRLGHYWLKIGLIHQEEISEQGSVRVQSNECLFFIAGFEAGPQKNLQTTF
jgi:hypothetical protein